MKLTRVAALAAALTALAALAVFAAEGRTSGRYESDPAHSSVTFKIKHMGLSNVAGSFDKFKASIDINYEQPEKSSVTASVETASVNTANEARDKHLRSADFFDVEKYPEISFKSTKVKPLGDDTFEVSGNLNMKGVSKPVTFKVELLGTVVDPKAGEKAGFEAIFKIDRTQFGMEPSAFLGNEVTLTIAVEAARAKPEPAAAKG